MSPPVVSASTQLGPNYNKTIPIQIQLGNSIEVIDASDDKGQEEADCDDCKCLASLLGMDRDRVSRFCALFLALFATVSLTISIFLVKMSVTLNASEIATIKFLVQIAFCLPMAYLYRRSVLGPREARWLLICRGFTGVVSILACYFSIRLISFADSMVIRYSSPIITAIFARFLLKEKFSWVNIVSFFLGVIGVLFVIRPAGLFGSKLGQAPETLASAKYIAGTVLAGLGAVAAGSTFVFVKMLTSQNIHFSVIIFYFSSVGVLASLLLSIILSLTSFESRASFLFSRELLSRDISIGLLAGLVSFIGHVCITLAIAKQNSAKISLIRASDILVAFFLEYAILQVVPNILTLVGAAFVVTGISIIFIYKLVQLRQQKDSYTSTNQLFRI